MAARRMTRRSKFKRQRKRSILKTTDLPVVRGESPAVKVVDRKTQHIQLSEEDRITYTYGIDSRGSISEVVVSYDLKVERNWETVKLYDNTHDLNYLHRHTKIAPGILEDVVSTEGVKKKGNPHNWLTWSIDDIKLRYRFYKKAYLRRMGKG